MGLIDDLRTRLFELPLQDVADCDAVENTSQVIPTILYQTWQDARFGKTHAKSIATFRACNPDLSFRLYDQDKCKAYMKAHWGDHPIYEIFERSVFGPMKADIFRYCILHERGGYYFDISKGCSVQLTSLHDRKAQAIVSAETHEAPSHPARAVASQLQHPKKNLLQWGLGFAPGHAILARLIDRIVAAAPSFAGKVFEDPKNAIWRLTGPGMYTRAVHDVLLDQGSGGITQCGIDFDGYGIFELPGSRMRYRTVPGYSGARDQAILR